MAYEGTPYQHPAEGYVESVRSITLDDIRAFYQDHYVRNNIVVGVGGGYPPASPNACARTSTRCPKGRSRRSRRRAAGAGRDEGPDRRQANRRVRGLVRIPDHAAAQRSRLRSAARRELVPRRAPQLGGAALPGDPRNARHELRQLLVHRGVPGRLRDTAAAGQRRPAQPVVRNLDPSDFADRARQPPRPDALCDARRDVRATDSWPRRA